MTEKQYVLIGHRNNKTEVIFFDLIKQKFVIRQDKKNINFVGVTILGTAIISFLFRPLKQIYISENYILWLSIGVGIGAILSVLGIKAITKSIEKQTFKSVSVSIDEVERIVNESEKMMKSDVAIKIFLLLLMCVCPIVFYFSKNAESFLLVPISIVLFFVLSDFMDHKRRKQCFRMLKNKSEMERQK